MTPSLARMVLARRNALALPLKWFSIPQCWRYERTTRGRRREHYQWNLDVWGAEGLTAEAELLGAAVGFMSKVGLTSEEVGVKVSTRSVLSELLVGKLGLAPERFASTCVLIDKLDKLPQEEVRAALQEQGLSAESCDLLFSTLALTDLDALAEVLGDNSPAVRELTEVFRLGAAYGYSDWLVLDLTVVRGLAYYTGIVFEGFDRSGELRAIFGGGRYDKLLGSFGGEDLPAAGFGFGDAVIVELLKMTDKLPSLSRTEVQAVVFPFDEQLRETAMGAAAALRGAGMATDLVLDKKKTKWAFKHAERLGAEYLVFIAPSEAAEGNARIKDLASGEEEDVPLAGLAEWVAKK
jgi:histidyl-tRNA synthetase